MQIDEFMFHCEMKDLSKKTMISYEQTLRLFSRFLTETFDIEDAKAVKTTIIRQYIKYLQERGKYTAVKSDSSKRYNYPDNRTDLGKRISPATINNYIRNIKVFFTFLKEQGYIKVNVAENIKQIKTTRKPKEFISDDDFLRLMNCLDVSKFAEYRDYTIIQLIFDTGMRLGECLMIRFEDLDLNKSAILLRAENTKSKRDRYVYFSQHMQRELRRWIQYKDRYKDSDYLFCTVKSSELTVSVFEKNFKKYTKRIGLDNAHPHQLRNNFAKRFLMSGGDIFTLSKILGHSSVTITEKAYLDLTDEDIRQNYQKYSPLNNLMHSKKK